MKNKKEKIKDWFNKVGQTIAGKLNGWINPLSSKVKKAGFLLVGVTIAIACMMLIVQAIQSEGTVQAVKVDSITKPADIYETDTLPQQDSEQSIIEQYNRMIRFKNLVDKLNSSSDSHALDSLMKAHPGLQDSLREFVERYYSHRPSKHFKP